VLKCIFDANVEEVHKQTITSRQYSIFRYYLKIMGGRTAYTIYILQRGFPKFERDGETWPIRNNDILNG